MFYELIYTRCKQGIDILRKGQVISGEGYKVYACTPEIMEEGILDLPFFANAVQTKQSYNDPDFMDDAYLFYVPDTGSGFLIEFHPVIFDKEAKGNYSHRPGNFINQALIGDFSEKYPFELFKNNKIWYAKEKGEEYYYETAPSNLEVSSKINKEPGIYSFEEIKAFISNGRAVLLAKAVSFLISQFEKKPEDRKYLVIKDENSCNIELWIAAIECVFSPKIAASVSFASRMEKFVSANRYTVNQMNVFQLQMNLQDPKQMIRFRAMIVGVDDRDKSNSNTAKPLASSPYVLLDGKEKNILFGNPKDEELSDISNEYFELIKSFSDEIKEFCRLFLQMSDVNTPDKNIFDIYKLYKEVKKRQTLNNQSILNVIKRLEKYNISNEKLIKIIYNTLEENLSKYLKEDLTSAFEIINWLDAIYKKNNDMEAQEKLFENICNSFIDILFHKPDNSEASAYWKQIKTTKFKEKTAGLITDFSIIEKNSFNLNTPELSNYKTFLNIYLDCSAVIGSVNQNDFTRIIEFGIRICAKNDNKKIIQEIVDIYSKNSNKDSQEFLFELSEKRKELSKFIIDYMINSDETIVKTDKSVRKFCNVLKENSGNSIIFVLKRRLNTINKINDYIQFIETINEYDCIDKNDLKLLYENIDKKLNFEKDSIKIAEKLLENCPNEANCNISLHLCALSDITNKSKKETLEDILEEFVKRGFPNIKEDSFFNKFIDLIVKLPDDKDDLIYITYILEKDPQVYYFSYIKELFSKLSKYHYKCAIVIWSASKLHNKEIDNILVKVMVETKQTEKSLNALKKVFDHGEKTKEEDKTKNNENDDDIDESIIEEIKEKENKTLKYLNGLIENVLKINEENKQPSFFESFFKTKKKEKDQDEKRT